MAKYSVLLVLVLVAACHPKTIESAIREQQYLPVTPPSTLLTPGTIVKIVSDKPLKLERVCSAVAALGENLPVAQSPSVMMNLQETLKNRSTVDAGYERMIKGKLAIKGISRVKLKLSKVEIHELSLDVIAERQPNQSAACRKVIALLLSEPKTRLAMVLSTLKADAEYKLDSDVEVSVSADVEKEILRGLDVGAGTVHSAGRTITVAGTGLYWGLRTLSSAAAAGLKPPETRGVAADAIPLRDMHIADVPPTPGPVEVRDAPGFAEY